MDPIQPLRKPTSLFQAGFAVEILHLIFSHIPLEVCVKRGALSDRMLPLHICRSWRAAALSCLDVWERVPLHSPFMAEFAEEHTRQWLPGLTVDVLPGSMIDVEALSTLFAHPARIKTLVCRTTQESSTAIRNATNLESLSIWDAPFPGPLEHDRDIPHPLDCYEDADDFGGAEVLRRLKELRLHGKMSFERRLLEFTPLLTSLELTLSHRLWSSLDSLFDTLRATPLLQSLALRGRSIPGRLFVDPGVPSSDAVVRLQHLHSMCLESHDYVLSRILQHLVVPVCTRVALVLLITDRADEEAEYFQELGHEDYAQPWNVAGHSYEQLAALFNGRVPGQHPLQHLSLDVREHFVYPGEDEVDEFWQHLPMLVATLGCFPCLSTLDLQFGRTGTWSNIDTTFERPINLPLLKRFHVSATCDLIIRIAEAVEAPQTAHRAYTVLLPHVLAEDVLVSFTEELDRMFKSVLHHSSDKTAGSYTRLDITSTDDEPIGGVRVVARGRTSNLLASVVDFTVRGDKFTSKNRNYLHQYRLFYARAVHELIPRLPLGALHTVRIASAVDIFRNKGSETLGQQVFRVLARARRIDVEWYSWAITPLLRAIPNTSARPEHIRLRSMRVELDADVRRPRLSAAFRSASTQLSLKHCAVTEQDVQTLRAWAGEANLKWDGRDEVDCSPSWGAGDSPWMEPDAREVRFWRPDLWEGLLLKPDDALAEV